MTDTIEWLEAIGRDASLRHASTEELTRILARARASEALAAAVVSGDCSLLFGKFGKRRMPMNQSSQTGYEDDELDNEGDDIPPLPQPPELDEPVPQP